MAKSVDKCVLNRIDYEGTSTEFGGFVQLVTVSQQFVEGLGEGAEGRSSVFWDSRVNVRPCGWDKR